MRYLILVMVFALMSTVNDAQAQILSKNSEKKLYTQKYKEKSQINDRKFNNKKRVRDLKRKQKLDKRKRKRLERKKRQQRRTRQQKVKNNKKYYGTPASRYYSSNNPLRIFKGER
ncbi:hypothetical protein RCC89_10240 [Cytophagaceae bacterium ABcell3]|nr:hypothetical protein RCC89_10240 [Cytophagaceae bacterium ABcell3]